MNNTSNNKSNLDIKAILFEFFRHWRLFLVSILTVILLAGFYMKFAAKTYRIEATILMKTDQNNVSADAGDFFEGYELINKKKNFQNEIMYMRSTPLIRDVIEDLGLEVSYYTQDDIIPIPKEVTFSLRNMYKESPFTVIVNQDHNQVLNTYFYIRILDEERFVISAENEEAPVYNYKTEEIVSNSVPYNKSSIYRFGDLVEDDHSSFRVLLNTNYDEDKFLGKDLFFLFNNLSYLSAVYQNNLYIRPTSFDATTAQITFIGDNKMLSIDFVDGLIKTYIEKNLQAKNFLAVNTLEYIDRQLSSISDSLGMTEQQLQNFRSSYNVMNIDEKAQMIYSQLQSLQVEKDGLDTKLRYLQQMEDYFEANKDSSKILAPSSIGLEDELLNDLIQELTSFNKEKQQIVQSNQLMNPRLKTLNNNISNLKNVISENLRFSINTTSKTLDELNNRIGSLNAEFSRLPRTQRKLLGIERKFKMTDAAYTSLLEKRIQAQIAKASNLPDAEIIEPPRFDAVASPNKMLIAFGSLFLGLFLPIIYVLLKNFFTDTISSKDEIKRYSTLQNIGFIPNNDKQVSNVISKYPNSAIAEAFHSLRSNLVYYLLGETHKTILVTSSLPGEGKSFTALNIATSFANTNNKTVLLEFDLRKPGEVYEELEAQALLGISSYLVNKAKLDEIIVPSAIHNLDIIQAGALPPNPVELISTQKAANMLYELKERYDYVIIDTPPYGLVTDAFILMNHADLKLYVSRLGVITKKVLTNNMEDIESKKIENIYMMINDGDAEKEGYSNKAYYDPRKRAKAAAKRKLINKFKRK